MNCPNLRIEQGIWVRYKDIHCSCDGSKVDRKYMDNVCKCDYKQCSYYKRYGIVNERRR